MKQISEKDLYNFVLFPGELSKDKILYIESNFNTFKAAIDLLKEMKNNLDTTVNKSIIDNISKKVRNYNKRESIVLNKIIPSYDANYLVLAADSPNDDSSVKTDTFRDSNNLFLCKVQSNPKNNKIYLFSNEIDKISEFTITLMPSGNNYNINLEDIPLIVSPRKLINSIRISF